MEQAKGHVHNMVDTLMYTQGFGAQDSINAIARWYRENSKEFLAAMSDLPISDDPKVNEELRKYIDGLGQWVTANHEWSFQTERYWGGKFEEAVTSIADEIVIKLMPKDVIPKNTMEYSTTPITRVEIVAAAA